MAVKVQRPSIAEAFRQDLAIFLYLLRILRKLAPSPRRGQSRDKPIPTRRRVGDIATISPAPHSHGSDISCTAKKPRPKTYCSRFLRTSAHLCAARRMSHARLRIPHPNRYSITFSCRPAAMPPDSRFVVTTHGNHTIRLWKVASRTCLASFTGESAINALTTNGKVIVVGEASGYVHVLRIVDIPTKAA